MDPEIGRPIEDIGMLRGIAIEGGHVRVDVLITIEGCPLKDRITQDVTAAVQPLEGVERVEVPPHTDEPRSARTVTEAPRRRRARGHLPSPHEDLVPRVDLRDRHRVGQGRRRQVERHR